MPTKFQDVDDDKEKFLKVLSSKDALYLEDNPHGFSSTSEKNARYSEINWAISISDSFALLDSKLIVSRYSDRQILIKEFLAGFSVFYEDCSNLYSINSIPEEKFQSASESFLKPIIERGEEIVVFYDNTFFGVSDEGFAMTAGGIYCSEEDEVFWVEFSHQSLDNLRLKDTEIHWDGGFVSIKEKKYRKLIFEIIKKIHMLFGAG